MLHEEITKDIIGAAMAVLNELKPGLEVALLLNFKDANRRTFCMLARRLWPRAGSLVVRDQWVLHFQEGDIILEDAFRFIKSRGLRALCFGHTDAVHGVGGLRRQAGLVRVFDGNFIDFFIRHLVAGALFFARFVAGLDLFY
jgi:hypothetical protein